MEFRDSNKEGQIAEDLMIEYWNSKGCDFIDVRTDKFFQDLDVDFIIPKKGYTKESCCNVNDKNEIKKYGHLVEIKLDKVIHSRHKCKNGVISHGTGNFVYELISHNNPGCLARCYADLLIYVCVDVYDEVYKLEHAYLIDLYNLRKYMTKNHNKLQLKGIQNIDNIEENVLNILINIKDIENIGGEDKIIKHDYVNELKPFFPLNKPIIK